MEAPPSEGERGPAPRVQDSTGHHRHRIERRLTAHQANEEKFLAEVAGRIESLMDSFSATSLILCAPPRALGTLRVALAKAGRDFELATIAKDLTKETAAQLDRRVRIAGVQTSERLTSSSRGVNAKLPSKRLVRFAP